MKTVIDEIKRIQKKIPDRTVESPIVPLIEEVGELTTEVAIKVGRKFKTPGPDGIVGEGIDVIVCVLDIIILEKPDITVDEILEIAMNKIKRWEKKYVDA